MSNGSFDWLPKQWSWQVNYLASRDLYQILIWSSRRHFMAHGKNLEDVAAKVQEEWEGGQVRIET